jgi:glycosyltransferase involved in cell wall biosynthesis
MVGDAPYARAYVQRLKEIAGENVVFTGYLFGRGYRELVSHAYGYVQATEVGGTHPALVESMGMGNGVLVADTPENREVAGDAALLFSLSDPQDLTEKMRIAIEDPALLARLAERGRRRVREIYNWERVTDAYERLLDALARKDVSALELEMGEAESNP